MCTHIEGLAEARTLLGQTASAPAMARTQEEVMESIMRAEGLLSGGIAAGDFRAKHGCCAVEEQTLEEELPSSQGRARGLAGWPRRPCAEGSV